MHFSKLLALACVSLAGSVTADVHHLFTGTFGSAYVYSIEFDDEALTLTLANTIASHAGHSWIAFDYQKKNLYAAAGTEWSSYSVVNSTSLTYDNSVTMGGNCTDSTKAIFIAASSSPPYNAYGTPFGGDAYCGNVISVDSEGVLSEVIQNYTYSSTSGVHGVAFSPDNSYLYSADDSGNSVWAHKIDETTGTLEFVEQLEGPESGADPRHITVHPNGTYAYVIFEGANELAVYSIDQTTGKLAFTNTTYPLIETGDSDSDYWSDEVALSYSGKYLWATSRARNTDSTGYISAFSLDSTGAIESQLFLTSTTTSGGTANSVAPSDFSDEFVALADSAEGFVQIWKFNGTGADVVATLNISGCCANAVWYD